MNMRNTRAVNMLGRGRERKKGKEREVVGVGERRVS